jgi:hypothetical protein
LKSALHHDAPVAGINMLNVVAAAVNRRTSSGKLLGPEQAVTPYEAFRAITKDAAWQYFEEHRKGTLEVGKLADGPVEGSTGHRPDDDRSEPGHRDYQGRQDRVFVSNPLINFASWRAPPRRLTSPLPVKVLNPRYRALRQRLASAAGVCTGKKHSATTKAAVAKHNYLSRRRRIRRSVLDQTRP